MKKFYIALKVLIVVIIIGLVADATFITLISKWRPEIKEPADAVIILGAAINTPALKNRTLEGLRLYEEGKAQQLILSGGKISDSDISEAEYMARILRGYSEKDPNYLIEDMSHNTYENMRNSKAKLGDRDSIIIVSDEFHLARAVLLAKRMGFEKVNWSSPEPSYYSAAELRFYYFREFLAMINYIPKFIFG